VDFFSIKNTVFFKLDVLKYLQIHILDVWYQNQNVPAVCFVAGPLIPPTFHRQTFCIRDLLSPDLSCPDLLRPALKLLAEMLRLCPKGQENNIFFNCLFLNKLPRELRVLLSKAELVEKQTLGVTADSFTAHTGDRKRGHHGGGNLPWGQQHSARWLKKKSRCGGSGDSGQQITHTGSHGLQASMGSALCFLILLR